MTLDRWTFVIDKAGKIIYKNVKVNPGQVSRPVLEILQSERRRDAVR